MGTQMERTRTHGSVAQVIVFPSANNRTQAAMGVYPFMFGSIKDFEPVVQEITKKGLKEPYDWDELAQMYFPKAEELAKTAEEAEKNGEKEKASEYYLYVWTTQYFHAIMDYKLIPSS